MSRRVTIADLSPKFQAEAYRQITTKTTPTMTPTAEPTAKPRIRQKSGDGLNKWEREHHERIRREWRHVYREPTLPLANGLRYKPDFLVHFGGDTEAHEVKGHMRDDAAAKIKMAAHLYPWIKFRLFWKERGQWKMQEVLP
ncbi:hypothetical protein Ga0100231_024010 [Opitutaceae bacterium TAV4]|nr:hypothetical protein Ga0100231_024010 [Opitutaceae bacterium TAV4]RRK00777.1 hypothetical protein Ga0100230_023585 [Opitutaceae bacterium TAV3]